MNRSNPVLVCILLAATALPVMSAPLKVEAPQFVRQWMSGQKFDQKKELSGDFYQCRVNGASFAGMKIQDASFRMCDLSNANMKGVVLGPNVRFFRVTLNEADFAGADLAGAEIDSVNFRGADFRDAKNIRSIRRSNFQRADLRGADFSKVPQPFIEMEWDDAVYDAKTKFPAGFDPQANGLKLKK